MCSTKKSHMNFYECCDLTKKVYLMYMNKFEKFRAKSRVNHLKCWVPDKILFYPHTDSQTSALTYTQPHSSAHLCTHPCTPALTPGPRAHPHTSTPTNIHDWYATHFWGVLRKEEGGGRRWPKYMLIARNFFEKSILNDNFLLSYSTTPKTSPNKPGSLRARRTGKFGFFSNNSLYLLEFHSLKSLHIIILSKKLKCGQHIDQFKN